MSKRFALFFCVSVLAAAAFQAPSPAQAQSKIVGADEIAFQLAPTRGIRPAMDLPAVTFRFNSYALTEQAKRQLDEVGDALSRPAFANSQFEIAGHTDAVGSEAYNQVLSERRARAVTDYLVEKFGIPRSRLKPVGWGETQLKPGIDPEDGANRRVEIVNRGKVQ